MFNSYYLGLFIHVGMGRLGSRWQVLFLATNAVDDEDELEAFAYCFLTICSGCSAVCLILWALCSEAWCIDYSDDCIKLLWVYMMRLLFYRASLCIFSIVFYPCAVSNTIESAVLSYLDYRPWLPGTLFSAPFPCFVRESWAVVTLLTTMHKANNTQMNTWPR